MNVLWLMLITVAVVLIQLILFKVLGKKGITYTRYLSKDRAAVGDEVDMIEDISLRRVIPAPWVRAESRIPPALAFSKQKDLNVEDEMFHRSVFTLMPYRRIHRRYHMTCMHRGLYSLETVTLTTGDLMGIHMAHETVNLDAQIVVYPRLLPPEAVDLSSIRWQGEVTVRRWIQPDPFLVNGIREYRLGDNPRDIHAGATARTGTLQVKTHDYTASPKIVVVLNVQLSENQYGVPNPQEKESMEPAISLAATMIDRCAKENMEFGFVSNGTLEGDEKREILLFPGTGRKHYEDCMDALARILVVRRCSIGNCLEEMRKRLKDVETDIVILSCYQSEDITEAEEHLRADGHGVVHTPIVREEVRSHDHA